MFITAILKAKGDAVVTVRPDDAITDTAKLLKEKRIGAAVVTTLSNGQNEQIVGMISERDIVCALGELGQDIVGKKVRDLMTPDVITCQKNHTAEYLMDAMTRHRIRHLPVIENSKLVGLVSIGDVVKARLAELQIESDQMLQYISGEQRA